MQTNYCLTLILLQTNQSRRAEFRAMARVVIATAVLLGLLGYAASPCSRMTAGEAEQVLRSKLVAWGIDEDCSTYSVRIPDFTVNCTSVSTRRQRRYCSITAMVDASHSPTDAVQVTSCVCDSLSLPCNTGPHAFAPISSSDSLFLAEGEVSAEKLLAVSNAGEVYLLCAVDANPPPTDYACECI